MSMSESFNACAYLLDRRLAAGDENRLALTGPGGELTYGQLHQQVLRAAGALRGIGLQPEQRMVMCMADSPEFVIAYLAAMRIGAIPVPMSTMTNAAGLGELLRDSRARLLAVTGEFAGLAHEAITGAPDLRGVLAPDDASEAPGGLPWHGLGTLLSETQPDESVYPTTADSPAFWLYTSGTTGSPKGAMHRHGSIQVVCETYGAQVLGITRAGPVPVGGEGLLRLRTGKLGAVPAVGRCRGRARTGTVAARGHSRPGPRVRRHAVLRRPDVLRQHAARRPARGCAGRRAAGGLRRRGPAGRTVHAMDDALRRGHPRRHRHDRDAAHLPVQPGRPSAPGQHGRDSSRLRPQDRGR